MSFKVQKITEPLVLGEGPHWDEDQQALFFVSIFEKTIHKYVLATGKHTKTTLDGRPGFLVPMEGKSDQFVVGLEHKFVVVQWDGEDGSAARVVRELGEVDTHQPSNRLNDGKADPRGRLFAGTMGIEDPPGSFTPERGALYSVDSSGSVQLLADKIGISNGLAWDLREKAFYYIDSLELNVRRYDYDVDTGAISNMRYIFDLRKNNVSGLPDGATIDTDGNLWIAVYNSSSVIKIDPRTGKLLQTVSIPAKQVTSVTFGGPDYDVLFVTTASKTTAGEVQLPPCGATFMVTGLGVKGHRNTSVKVHRITEPLLLGEGPHWDEDQQALFFVSIFEKTLHKYVLATGKHTKTTVDGRPSFIIPVEGKSDQFAVGLGHKFVVVHWDGEEGSAARVVRELGEVDTHQPKNNINDGKADPRGRLFAGTMRKLNPPGQFTPRVGALYRLDSSGSVQQIADKIGISNGLAWDLREKAFYYIDSLEFKVRRYDYDVDTGAISHMHYIFDLRKNNISGLPDGVTIDTDGNLWVAVHNSSSVIKIDPRTGGLLQTVPMPVGQVTSVTFGGPDYDLLFVTTGRTTSEKDQPLSGCTFIVTGLGVKGYRNVSFKLKSLE